MAFGPPCLACGSTDNWLPGQDGERCSCGWGGSGRREPARDLSPEIERLTARVNALEERCGQYRELVRCLATAKDKGHAWYVAKAWCPFWRDIAFDLPDESEQKAMLFE